MKTPQKRIWNHPVLGRFGDKNKVTIYLDDKEIEAYDGDSIAAALWANGVKVFNHSLRFREPRGPACMIGLCNCCSMTVDGIPNVRTCIIPVRNGIRLSTQGKTK